MKNTLKVMALNLFAIITLFYSSLALSQTKFIGRLTVENFFTFIQLPENQDLFDFIRGFSIRLRDANPARASFPDRDELGRIGSSFVTQGDRRLDALARLLVGDEVCAAVVFDGDHTLYAATNNDGHSKIRSECPLWERFFTLHNHLSTMARISLQCSLSIPHHDWIETTRMEFVVEALSSLIKVSLKIDSEAKFKKSVLKQEKTRLLKEFSKKLNSDFYDFETAVSDMESDEEDIVEKWIGNLRPRLKKLIPSGLILNVKETEGFYVTIKTFFRDLLKVERFFSTIDHKDAYARALVNAMGSGKLNFEIIDEGGEGVHAEVKLIAFFVKIHKKIRYIGIGMLCCPYCNVVVKNVLCPDYFEKPEETSVPIRGFHAATYQWPIHTIFRTSEENLKKFLGEDLYSQYIRMKGKSIESLYIAPQDRGDFALTILENLSLLGSGANRTIAAANKAKAEELKISVPDGDRRYQEADSSSTFSKTPIRTHHEKAFYLIREERVVEVGTDEFDKLQSAYSKPFHDPLLLFDAAASFGNGGLLYTDEHIHRILKYFLPETEHFTVTPPAAAIFENAGMLINIIENALQAALIGNVVVMPIHLHGSHWVGAVFRQQADGVIQVIYNNPQGYRISLEPNAVKFVETIQTIVERLNLGVALNIIDLHLRQQYNGVDCGPFTVDNLVRIAKNAAKLNGLARDQIIAIAMLQQPVNGSAVAIRNEHSVIFPTLGLPLPTEIIEDDLDEDLIYDAQSTSPITTEDEAPQASPPIPQVKKQHASLGDILERIIPENRTEAERVIRGVAPEPVDMFYDDLLYKLTQEPGTAAAAGANIEMPKLRSILERMRQRLEIRPGYVL